MRLTQHQENAKALAALLGIEEEDATKRLRLRIAVNFDPHIAVSRELGEHVIAMLSRTVEDAGVPDGGLYTAEVIIGPRTPATTASVKVYAGQEGGDFVIRDGTPTKDRISEMHRALLVISACYVAAAAMRAALGPSFPIQNTAPIVLRWSDLFGAHLEVLNSPIDIDEAYLAGAGAVGNGFLYALRYFDVRGTLFVTDSKKVTVGGLNRCLFFGPEDVDHSKATRICEIAKPYFPRLNLVPVDATLAEARKLRGENFLIQRLVVCVDSRRVRRSLQAELPREVFDASTTDVREIVLHFNRQPMQLACLSCVYPENERERKHEENVAEALGVTLEEVRSDYITELVARKVCCKYVECKFEDLIGRAFDTVYKELCGLGKLQDVGSQQVLAPFSFVSILAGAYLAVEFMIRIASKNPPNRFNYWRASPWHSPNPLLHQVRSRDPQCEFCSKPYFRRAIEQAWGT